MNFHRQKGDVITKISDTNNTGSGMRSVQEYTYTRNQHNTVTGFTAAVNSHDTANLNTYTPVQYSATFSREALK